MQKFILLEGLCIVIGSDATSYFRSAVNRVHATAPFADFTVTKQSFSEMTETTQRPEMTSSSTSVGGESHKRVHFGVIVRVAM